MHFWRITLGALAILLVWHVASVRSSSARGGKKPWWSLEPLEEWFIHPELTEQQAAAYMNRPWVWFSIIAVALILGSIPTILLTYHDPTWNLSAVTNDALALTPSHFWEKYKSLFGLDALFTIPLLWFAIQGARFGALMALQRRADRTVILTCCATGAMLDVWIRMGAMLDEDGGDSDRASFKGGGGAFGGGGASGGW